MSTVLSQIEIEDLENDFLGKALDRWRTRRDEKRDARQAAKLERINAKAEARRSGGGIFSGLTSAVGNIFGGMNQQNQQMPMMQDRAQMSMSWGDQEAQAQQAASRQRMIMIVVALLVIAVVVFMVMKNKKK